MVSIPPRKVSRDNVMVAFNDPEEVSIPPRKVSRDD